MSLIKQLAKKHGLTQTEFGRQLGYTKKHISGVSVGRNIVSEQLIVRVWQEFGVTDAALLLPYAGRRLQHKKHNENVRP